MLRKIFIITITASFIFLLIIVNLGKQRVGDGGVDAPLPENHLEMEDISLVRVLDLDGSYVTMKAETAYFDHNTDLLTMTNTEFSMLKSGTNLVSHADQGMYRLNETLTTRGNIYGTWNDLQYKVDKQGALLYDFRTERAVVGDNVTLIKNNSRIFAKELNYDGVKQTTLFTGGVDMTVVQGDIQ